MAQDNLQAILQILRDRGIACDRYALEKAYNDPEHRPAIDEWVEEYLGPETLLSKDEATLYASLVKGSKVDCSTSQDSLPVQAISDVELRTAIDELKRSTANIEKQTEILKMQQNALQSMIKSERQTINARISTEQGQLQTWEAASSRTTEAVEELSQTLVYKVTELAQQDKETTGTLQMQVNSTLREDEKLLLSLQKLATDLEPVKSENTESLAKIQELCAKLIKHTVEGVRTKLDRVYLEALDGSNLMQNGDSNGSQEAADLQEELESLYAEILPVAQMSAEQQFLEPARKFVANTDGRNQERATKAFDYINDCLEFLLDRLQTISTLTEASQSYSVALNSILDTARHELSRPLPLITSPTKTKSSNHHRRKSSVAQSPLRPRGLRRRSSGSTEGLEPEQQLARNLGVTLPTAVDTEDMRAEALEQLLAERVKKLEIHNESLRQSTENSIPSQLCNAATTLQILHDVLHSQSKYGKVHLLDPEMVESVQTFEQDVAYVKTNVEEINLEVLQGRNVKRDQIVQRWQ